MALPKETGEAAAVEVERFCNQRSPEDSRSQIRLEYEVKGSTITIVERRAPWNEEFGSDWSRQPIAQLRFHGRAKTWTLYWPRHTGRWHRYDDLAAAAEVGPLLRRDRH